MCLMCSVYRLADVHEPKQKKLSGRALTELMLDFLFFFSCSKDNCLSVSFLFHSYFLALTLSVSQVLVK